MTERYEAIIRAASFPLEPIATDIEPCLPRLADIRSVLFDIYGTLLISASGDIGAADPAIRGEAIAAALHAIGHKFTGSPTEAANQLRQAIDLHHGRSRAEGIEYPEVDIVDVWRQVCLVLHERGQLAELPSDVDFERLAIEFEVRVNPVWAMPGMFSCVEKLGRLGVVMGIISNAQFFTPLVFPAIVGKSLDQLGFAPELRYYSYEHGCAKPGRDLYEMALGHLGTLNIQPRQVLYVGNDMRNDIWPAAEVGFRTALFAGDRRSLRMRSDDACHDQYGKPDAIVTELLQIPPMIEQVADAR